MWFHICINIIMYTGVKLNKTWVIKQCCSYIYEWLRMIIDLLKSNINTTECCFSALTIKCWRVRSKVLGSCPVCGIMNVHFWGVAYWEQNGRSVLLGFWCLSSLDLLINSTIQSLQTYFNIFKSFSDNSQRIAVNMILLCYH